MSVPAAPPPSPVATRAAERTPLPPLPPPDDVLPFPNRLAMLLLPLAALVVLYLGLRVLDSAGRAGEMAAAAGISFAGLGTTVIFGAAVLGNDALGHLSTFDLALVVLVLNTALALVYVGASDLLERIPFVGPKLAGARAQAIAVAQERPWIRRWATAGLAIFVISPLPGSGVLGGTLVGRVAGLTRKRTFVAVAIANAAVCALYYFGADALEGFMRERQMSVWERVGAFVGGVAVMVVLVKLLLRSGTKAASSDR